MKLSKALLTGLVLLASSQAFAKYTYLDGTVAEVNSEEKTISIVAEETGKTKTFRYTDSARVESFFEGARVGQSKRPSALREGEKVTLRLK